MVFFPLRMGDWARVRKFVLGWDGEILEGGMDLKFGFGAFEL